MAFPSLAFAVSNIVTGQQLAQDQWGGDVIFMIDADDDGNPANGPEAVVVSNTEITGKLWSENYGWIRFQHGGTGVSVTIESYGGGHRGLLSGYAWGEMIGWIDFTEDPASGREGVYIDENGYFQGYAWSESVGWFAFGDVTNLSEKAQTTWLPGTDADGDLVPDAVEDTQGTDSGVTTSFQDTDNDGVADYVEGGYTSPDPASGDGNPDADGDGFPDYVELIAGSDEINGGSIPVDFDGDGVPDAVEQNQGTSPTDGGDFLDTDNDSVPDYVEVYAPNAADQNDDASKDQTQDSAASHVNVETDVYNSFTSGGTCSQIRHLRSKTEASVLDDAGIHFPVGLWDFEIHCDSPGDTADIKIYLDQVYDTTTWKYYKSDGGAYVDISPIVTFATESVAGTPVTTMSFSITDGSSYDEDGLVNGVILDPSGPGTNQPPTDIDITSTTVSEGLPLASVVGELSTTDPDVGDTHTYGLTCSIPGVDDGHFQIVGNQLWTATVFDYESPADNNTDGDYEICIVTTDEPGETYEENFTITVQDAFEDTDGDGMPNEWEVIHGFNPNDPSDGPIDTDGDDLTNVEEFNGGTNSTDPRDPDSDDDGLRDGFEVKKSLTDPNDPDSDSAITPGVDENDDGTTDPQEDLDGDGLNNILEYTYGSDPGDSDTDDDGLSDYEETIYGTSPAQYDTDGDGMSDKCEKDNGFNPLDGTDGSHDIDADGETNARECIMGTNPREKNKKLEEARGFSGAGKASIREWCVGKTREECAEFIVDMSNSTTRANFDENYARSLEIAQEINEGRSAQKITYIDQFGNERFAGFIKGKLATDGFNREAEYLVFRREVVRDVGFHASASDPNFMPVYTVSNFRDVPTDHSSYVDIVAMNSLGLLRADSSHLYRPGAPLKWSEFLQAMLWTVERDLLSFADLESLLPLDNVEKNNTLESLVYYTAFEEGLIPRGFDPSESLTRGTALEFMSSEYQLNLELREEVPAFRDIAEDHYLYEIVQAAHKRSWFDRSSLTRLEPEKTLSRALFASWFVGSLGAANPFLDTPAYNTVSSKLDRLYDDVYHREEVEGDKPVAGDRDTGFEEMSDAELALRARKLREEYRKKLTFEPSRLTLEMLEEWQQQKQEQDRIYKRQDFDPTAN